MQSRNDGGCLHQRLQLRELLQVGLQQVGELVDDARPLRARPVVTQYKDVRTPIFY